MIALDTNILVYAHRQDSEWHGEASTLVLNLASDTSPWAIPWPCIHEFYAIATHPKIYDPPSTVDEATDQIQAWIDCPSLTVIGESGNHWEIMKSSVTRGQIKGPVIHDARIAAICIGQGVTEFLTADRDFSRFPALVTRNPLLD